MIPQIPSALPHKQLTQIAYLNGRSGIFIGGSCSSLNTTIPLRDHMRRAHHLEGFQLEYPETQAWHWWSERYRLLCAGYVLMQLYAYSPSVRCDLVAHSLAADISREMLQIAKRPPLRRIVLIAPAMDHRVDWTQFDFEKMLVIYNPKDLAIYWGAKLPGHPFGWAGRREFTIRDPRITYVQVPDGLRLDRWGHGHFFKYPTMTQVGNLIENFLTSGQI